MTKRKPQLIVALDVDTLEGARQLIDTLSPVVDIFKVGSQLFTACGPAAVRFIQARGKKVFLDLKFHDIPNTVANAVRVAVSLSAVVNVDRSHKENVMKEKRPSLFMYTLHITGGEEMLTKALQGGLEEAKNIGVSPPMALGITVLTSEMKTDNIQKLVLERASLARKCGLQGVVASCDDVRAIREICGKDFVVVTPGIRPEGTAKNDQKRTATPAEAGEAGSDYIVVGRPVITARNPLKAAENILKEIDSS